MHNPRSMSCIVRIAAVTLVLSTCLFSTATLVLADQPFSQIGQWSGNVDAYLTGVSLAIDTNSNERVDTLSLPASFNVTGNNIPVGATLIKAYLYWGGTQTQPGGALSSLPDSNVTLTLPDSTVIAVTADVSYGSDGESSSYDVWLCRADVTAQINISGSVLIGTYQLDDYSGLVADGSSDNASAALLLVFSSAAVPHRNVILYDGLAVMSNNAHIFTISGFNVDAFGGGDLTYYSMEGDISGTGVEQVTVNGIPGSNGPITLTNAQNPAVNPMNHTITTSSPAQTDAIGVDIDKFDIGAALTNGDTTIGITYNAGTDKWWLCVMVISIVRQFELCPADIAADGNVNVTDLLALLAAWGSCP